MVYLSVISITSQLIVPQAPSTVTRWPLWMRSVATPIPIFTRKAMALG